MKVITEMKLVRNSLEPLSFKDLKTLRKRSVLAEILSFLQENYVQKC